MKLGKGTYVSASGPQGRGLRAKSPKGASLRKPHSGPSLVPTGYSDKAPKISCARDRPKLTFSDRNFKRKMKEKAHHRFSEGGGPGTGETDQKVHR